MPTLKAPFTLREVEALRDWQRWGSAPYRCLAHDQKLIVEPAGLRCPEPDCGHRRDQAEGFILNVYYCTKGHPCPADAATTEYWIHVDAEEADPAYEGRQVPFHCPHCGRDFTVEI